MTRTILNSVVYSDLEEEVVLISDAKLYLGLKGDTHDDLIVALITSAREEVEELTKRAIVKKTVTAYFDSINESTRMPITPVIEITSVKDDEDNDLTYKASGVNNPIIKLSAITPTIVVYQAGYETVPESLKLCVIKKVCEDFEFRTGIKVNQNGLLPNNWRNEALKHRLSWLM